MAFRCCALRSRKQDQRGVTLVLIALMIVVFFVMLALSIDLGVAYTARTSAQHAADAGALSGALALSKAKSAGVVDGLPLLASKNAAVVSNSYKVLGQVVSVANTAHEPGECTSGVNIVCVDVDHSLVTVVVSSPVEMYFARVVPAFKWITVKAVATAEASKNALGDRAIKPFYISNDIISPLDPKTPNRCTQALSDGTTILGPDGKLTAYAQQYIQNQSLYKTAFANPSSCFGSSGCPIQFWTQNAENPSQYGIVDLSDGQDNAGALVECAITHAYQDCFVHNPMYQCGAPTVGLETGGKGGQIVTALRNLIGYVNDTTRNVYLGPASDSDPTFLYDNLGSSAPEPTSPSLISVVIWDCTKPLPNGTQGEITLQGATVQGSGIAQVFVNRVDNKSHGVSTVFLIGAASCGNTQGGSGPGGVPVRLVHNGPR